MIDSVGGFWGFFFCWYLGRSSFFIKALSLGSWDLRGSVGFTWGHGEGCVVFLKNLIKIIIRKFNQKSRNMPRLTANFELKIIMKKSENSVTL
jgi:hypothetical protein